MTDEQHDPRDPFAGIPLKVLSLGVGLAHKAAREAPSAESNADTAALDLTDESVLDDPLAEIAPLVKIDEAENEMSKWRAAMTAVAFFDDDGLMGVDLEAVAAILEGFEREIAEGSKGLHLLYRGELASQKVSELERRIAYDGLEFFVALGELAGIDHEYVERAKTIISRLGPIAAEGNPDKDPRRYVLRNAIIAAILDALKDSGVSPSNYIGQMAKAWGLSESKIRRAWENAVNRRGKKSRVMLCGRCHRPLGKGARRVNGVSHDPDFADATSLVCRQCWERYWKPS